MVYYIQFGEGLYRILKMKIDKLQLPELVLNKFILMEFRI